MEGYFIGRSVVSLAGDHMLLSSIQVVPTRNIVYPKPFQYEFIYDMSLYSTMTALLSVDMKTICGNRITATAGRLVREIFQEMVEKRRFVLKLYATRAKFLSCLQKPKCVDFSHERRLLLPAAQFLFLLSYTFSKIILPSPAHVSAIVVRKSPTCTM